MNKLLIVILAVVSAAIGVFFYQTLQSKPTLELALVYPEPRLLHDFSLTSHEGQEFSKQDLRNKWSLLFFGYTSCPDVCPVTLQQLNSIYPKLKEITNQKMQVILVTADPKRDSVKTLNSYINYFNKEFVALRGGHDALYPFARNLGLMYAIADDSTEEYYLVNHSASIVLTNPDGNIQAIFKPKHSTEPGLVPSIDPDIMLSDFNKIYDQLN